MDAEEFVRNIPPRQRVSRLQKFKNDIRELKRKGYTDLQIRDWLAGNSVKVSRENVRKFIKRHLADLKEASRYLAPTNPIESNDVHELAQQQRVVASTHNGKAESQADKLRRLTKEQRDDAEKTQFKHDKTGSDH